MAFLKFKKVIVDRIATFYIVLVRAAHLAWIEYITIWSYQL